MTQSWNNILSDQPFTGYLSLPPTGQGPALVLLQEIWGVNQHIRDVADSYAQAGFVVLAPDVFWRLTARLDLNYDEVGNQKAFECYQALDTDLAVHDIVTAINWLKLRPEVTGKIGIIGYCLGGQLAYRSAVASEHIDAAVCYYGGGIVNHLDIAEQLTQPVIFHHGERDEHISTDDIIKVKAAFAGRENAQFYDYPQAGHGFNCWGRPLMYHQPSAALAQGRSLVFLAQQLCH
ncbi:dienelactone hydrolase family protein [Celerinatantimonas yamalensis]|uniref:Dienelactone hydrolase family protein n=1 Tax=Celerinatantimonas yamalensis TaxID=559956 RepID=A0ABW9G5K0_9GAMM